MRSRLEGSVAAALDGDELGWKYEPCVFASPKGQYLPDFEILRPARCRPWYLEVKPRLWNAANVRSRMEIIWESHADAVLLIFSPFQIHYHLGDGWQVAANQRGVASLVERLVAFAERARHGIGEIGS
jgi:hypothetical protein